VYRGDLLNGLQFDEDPRIDQQVCTGCKYCVETCPFGTPHPDAVAMFEGLQYEEVPRDALSAVLGNDDPQASVIGEIRATQAFYDYDAKYRDDATELIIPADLDPDLSDTIRASALEAYRALGAEGMARVDFLLERETNRFYVNELNSLPGFTNVSMYPKLWEATGLPYPRLLDRLIELALERHDRQSKLETHAPPPLSSGKARGQS